jgi:hypothetical protein
MCVHCAVKIMSEQVPSITGTTVHQPVDSEAVSSTADTAGRSLRDHVFLLMGVYLCVVATKQIALAWRCTKYVLNRQS